MTPKARLRPSRNKSAEDNHEAAASEGPLSLSKDPAYIRTSFFVRDAQYRRFKARVAFIQPRTNLSLVIDALIAKWLDGEVEL